MKKECLIQFDNVSYAYDSELPDAPQALKNISLSIDSGEFVAVLGHNGSGKSTLAKLCNAILVPQQGKVLVDSMDTSDEELTYDIRKNVGMVFQNPDNQLVATIVEDDVAFGPENLGVPPAQIRERVDAALKSVDMYDFRNFEPHKLSGGQKQRVAIAGIIAMQTRCIVLDEPTAMLDPKGRREVMQTVKRLNRELGITIVYITHFMDEAVQADRVVVIDGGTVLLDGTPREVFREKQTLKNAGLDIPAAAELTDMVRDGGVELPDDILTVPECIGAIARAWKARAEK